MKTSMKHIDDYGDVQERTQGKSSVLMIVVYVALFGAWLAVQLHN